ncbi:MAG: hypothetical protein KQJ78_08855 [Deltaproteobacteria bacterium]|nr:hypothetical protein [Deltaproteobacteria bacterium]
MVKKVEKPADVRLLPASAWPPPEAERADMLLKLAYLRGLLDALQYVQVAPDAPKQVLRALEGMNLSQVAAQVDDYYLRGQQRRDLPPAAVIFRVFPAALGPPPETPTPGAQGAVAPAPASPGALEAVTSPGASPAGGSPAPAVPAPVQAPAPAASPPPPVVPAPTPTLRVSPVAPAGAGTLRLGRDLPGPAPGESAR